VIHPGLAAGVSFSRRVPYDIYLPGNPPANGIPIELNLADHMVQPKPIWTRGRNSRICFAR
jgi:hypothetical protein